MPTNESFVDRLQRGDMTAFKEIRDKYYYQFCGRFISRFPHKHDLDDVISDVFEQISKEIMDFSSDEDLLKILQLRIKSRSNDALRKISINKKKSFSQDPLLLEQHEIADASFPNPFEEGRRAWFKDTLQKLPKRRQEIIHLTYIDGLKREEIAQMLNVSLSTVNNTHAQARAYFKHMWDNMDAKEKAFWGLVITTAVMVMCYFLKKS